MLKVLSLLLYYILFSSSIYAQTACGTKLNEHAPIYNQGSSLMCGAYSTTQILNSQYRNSISPIWTSLVSGTVGSQQPTEAMNAINKQAFLCKHSSDLEPTPDAVIKFHQSFKDNAYQLQKQLASITDLKPGDRLYSLFERRAEKNGFSTVKEYTNQLKKEKISSFKSTVKALYYTTFAFGGRFPPSETSFNEKIDSFAGALLEPGQNIYSSAVEFSLLGYSNYCSTNKVASKFSNVNLEKKPTEDLDCNQKQSAIDEKLVSNFPVLIGLNFETLYNKDSSRRGSGHYLTVVGKRCLEGEPEYLIRNSYGTSCDSHLGPSSQIVWPCDPNSGEFWLPLSKICQNVGSLYTPNTSFRRTPQNMPPNRIQ